MRRKQPFVSVIVCSYNGENTLADCLKSLKAQKFDGKLEIIVVDDGSTDRTYKIAKSFRGIRVIKNGQNLGLAASRNAGIKAAKGAIVAFTDDDCIARPTWIKQLYGGYTSDDILGVGGVMQSTDKSKFMLRYLQFNNPLQPLEYALFSTKNLGRRFWYYLKGLTGISDPKPKGKRPIYSFVGGNMSFRKDALKAIGMFDESFTFGGEDQELCRRMAIAHPKSLYIAPRAVIIHRFDSKLRDTLRRSEAYGIGNARMARKHTDLHHTIYPFPLLVIASLFLGVLNPWLFLSPLVITPLLYPKGLLEVLRTEKIEPLFYSYVQFLQEVYNNVGYCYGWWKFRTLFTLKRRQKVSPDADALLKPEREDTDAHVRAERPVLSLRTLVLPLGLVGLAGAATASSLITSTTLLHLPALAVLLLVPGCLLLRALGGYETRRPSMLRLSLMMSLGIFWMMLYGLLADVILPKFGFSQPLLTGWNLLLFPVATALILPFALHAKIAPRVSRKHSVTWEQFVLGGLLTLTLCLSFIGARLLNNNYTNVPAMCTFVAGAASVLFTVLKQKKLPKQMFALTLLLVSIASVWSYSLRSNYVFGWDIQQEFQVFQSTLSAGTWKLGGSYNPYNAMLSLTIFPVMLTKLSGLSGLAMFKVVSPIIFSFVPVFLYYIYRLFTKRWIAFMAAMVIVAQFYYMQQFSGEVRQQVAFLFFAGVLYLLLERRLKERTKQWLLGIFLLGLVVSHYSTTYLALIFFAGTYIAMRLPKLIRRLRTHQKQAGMPGIVRGWMVLTLLVGALLWYGPATHSYGNLQSFNETSSVGQVLDVIGKDIVSLSVATQPAPATTQEYLADISKYYHDTHTHFTYYPGATDKGIPALTQASIKQKSKALTIAYDTVNIIFSYGWWILGTGGIVVLLLRSYRARDNRMFELGVIGVIGIVAFVAIHIVPALQIVYNPSRLNEQVLMVVALPAILATIWLLKRRFRHHIRLTVASLMCVAFLIASGVVIQFVGGKPTANLNNFGIDYNTLYVQQTDLAATAWLSQNYTASSTVYADNYASLRLQDEANIDHGVLTDVTPGTIAEWSYVYADYTNVKDGIGTSVVGSGTYTYGFPLTFLEQNKDLVYTNGSAEIYK